LIFSKNKEEHEKHVCLVLKKLHEWGLYAKLEKCLFHQTEMEFLGFVATTEGLKMDLKKVETIVSWEPQRQLKTYNVFLVLLTSIGSSSKIIPKSLLHSLGWHLRTSLNGDLRQKRHFEISRQLLLRLQFWYTQTFQKPSIWRLMLQILY
jgi:hypothetical protein